MFFIANRIILHKKSFANEEIRDSKICRNGEILRMIDFRGRHGRVFYQERPGRVFQTGSFGFK